ncbi:peptidoglycan DD-metalloendopeptidase family protein [Corynebacterium casei]|uniref:peptidoglycan DD-metalloendopeptidase family protein n=1 Tax=Corynebacterium casei TaxID=160386 RepID=UPI003FD01C4E
MKKAIAIAVAIVLFLVLMITTILPSGKEAELCEPGGSTSAVGGVPAGEYSLPENNAMDSVTSEFGMRGGVPHQGIDVAQGEGTAIYAFADGVVAEAGSASGFGQWIVIDHQLDGDLVSTVYGHMMDGGVHVKAGDKVKAGQHIADEGYNGEVSPPGPGGSHLHFEVWEGGRLSGGTAVNPRPWLDQAVEPGSDSGDTDKEAGETTAPTGRGELQPDPRFSEENLQLNSVRMGRAIAMNFPGVDTIGGWRPSDATADDHPAGRAVDVMIPQWQSDKGVELGDQVTEYVLGNWEYFQVDYIIWRQQLIYPDSTSTMEDRGSPTQNHFDHVHISLKPSEMAQPNAEVGSAPVGGSASPAAAGEGDPNCDVDSGDHDMALNADNIPDAWVRPIQIAGGECSAVSAPLIAGLLEQESGFNTSAVSGAGASGPAQFMPGTWATAGAEMSEDGKKQGPPGSGDINDPKDAIPAAGRYLCGIAERQKPQLESGEIKGNPVELLLAGYNAGEGAVQQYGGVPPYAETQNYVKVIPEKAKKYEELEP